MMIAVAFFAAVAILGCAAADSVTTSLLLPDCLFVTDQSFPRPTFVGQVTVTRSTTYYTLDCWAGGAASYFIAGDDDSSYTFSESSASTQYLLENYTNIAAAASSSTVHVLQTSTINCDPLGPSGSATCTITCTDDEDDDATYTTNIESALYTVFFTTAAGYSAASSTAASSATPSPASSAATARSTTTTPPYEPPSTVTADPALSPAAKIGIGLGVPLGICAVAGVALLLYRHGKHKERSRMNQMGNLAPPTGLASGFEGKRFSDAGVTGQTLGRSPPVYSMEMQG